MPGGQFPWVMFKKTIKNEIDRKQTIETQLQYRFSGSLWTHIISPKVYLSTGTGFMILAVLVGPHAHPKEFTTLLAVLDTLQ